jgi:major type 1 subunit fimbrin (pilin)
MKVFNINEFVRRYVWCFVVLAVAAISTSANADCYFDTRAPYATGNGNNPYNISTPTTIVVPRDASTTSGSPFYTSPAVLPTANIYLFGCTVGAGGSGYTSLIGSNPASGSLFPVPGPGGAPSGLAFQVLLDGTSRNVYPQSGAPATGGINVSSHTFSITLVKTGPLPAGGVVIPAGPLAQYMIQGQVAGYVNLMNQILVTEGSCDISAPTVMMGTHNTNELPSIGSVTTAVPLPVTLSNCPSAIKKIAYNITPTYSSGVTNVAGLDGTGATGIGVQLLDSSSNVLSIGAGTQGSVPVVTGTTSYTIGLKARYYRTGSTITSGTANTTMTITMNYQ